MKFIRSCSKSSSPPFIPAEFERYIKEARDVLRIGDETEMETNLMRLSIALALREKEKDKELSVLRAAFDKDKELSVLRAAMDKELSVLRAAMDKDKELSVLRTALDKDKEMALLNRIYLERDAYRKSQLMHVTKRYVRSTVYPNGCEIS